MKNPKFDTSLGFFIVIHHCQIMFCSFRVNIYTSPRFLKVCLVL